MAVALIREAIRYPGRTIQYVDHHLGTNAHDMAQLMRHSIEGFIYQDPVLGRFDWNFQRLQFHLMAADTDALPPNWLPDSNMPPDEALQNLEDFEARMRERQTAWSQRVQRVSERHRQAEQVLAAQIAQAENEHIFEVLKEAAAQMAQEEPEPRSAWERLIEDAGIAFGPEPEGSPDSHEDSA